MHITEELNKFTTPEELTEVEKMAGLFFSPTEICIALGWNEEISENLTVSIQSKDLNDKIFCAYYRGRLQTEIQLRESVKQSAFNGSNPAQQTMMDYYNSSKV